jgi:Protein of unknown function (DUF3102)
MSPAIKGLSPRIRAEGERRELELLAEDIRRHHKAVERHARSMLDEAIAAGEALIEAKARLRHGEFGPFIAYCGTSRRSASLYMKLAREKGNVAILEASSIREALEALGGRRRPQRRGFVFDPAGPEPGQWQVDAWREAMAAEGRHEVLSYYVPAGKDRRRCLTTVNAAAYDRKAAAT